MTRQRKISVSARGGPEGDEEEAVVAIEAAFQLDGVPMWMLGSHAQRE